MSGLDTSHAPFCQGARLGHGVGVKAVTMDVWRRWDEGVGDSGAPPSLTWVTSNHCSTYMKCK
jgi:hypothetical protein